MQIRNYDNNEGRRVYVTEVIADNVRFLESPNKDNSRNEGSQQSNQDPSQYDGKPININDDDLPF
jgi:single-strand DNA-binding protein